MKSRDLVALVLALAAGLSVFALTVAALYDALADPSRAGLSQAYSSLLTATLGVMIGALAGYIGGRAHGGDDLENKVAGEPAAGRKTAGRHEATPPDGDESLSDSHNTEGPTQ